MIPSTPPLQKKAQINRLYKDVEFLTELRPYRNHQNLESLQQVTDFLRKEFRASGYTSEDQKWMAGGNEYTNIIASYNPEKSKRLIVGAHYDVGRPAGS